MALIGGLGLSGLWVGTAWAAMPQQPLGTCAAAARLESARVGVPEGLLGAIGLVESGLGATLGRRAAWPYAVDADGVGHWFATEAAAAGFVRAALAAGARAIDVGCFQIDLEDHPEAFGNLGQAFDPIANAAYAAGFLMRLRGRLGSWPAAIAAYHSATPALGGPYARLVDAAWLGSAGAVRDDPHVIRLGPPGGGLPRIVTP